MSQTGVRTIVAPEPGSSVVAFCVFIRAGAAEDERWPGVGSLTARAIFGKNYQQSSEGVRDAITDAGGNLEARWTPDYTVFTCVTNRAAFDDAMKLVADAMKSAEFDRETQERARREVAADIAREASDPFRVGYAEARAHLYTDDAYRAPYGGSPESLARLDAEKMRLFYNRRYTPANTVISIAGDVTEDMARTSVENNFVDYNRPEPRARLPLPPDPMPESSRTVRRLPVETTTVLAGYRAPAMGDADFPAFMVLDAVLGGGKSSRLFRQVRDTAGIGYAVGTYFPPLMRPGNMAAYVEFDAARAKASSGSGAADFLPSVEKLLVDTVESAMSHPPSEAEVERAKRFAIGAHALAHQRVRDRAFYLGWYETMGVGYAFDTELPRKLEAVTVDDVRRVARKYLGAHALVVVRPDHG